MAGKVGDHWRIRGLPHILAPTLPQGTHMAEQQLPAQEDELLERRRRKALRTLIDEMLSEIRLAANNESWTPESRERAESDLARIMEQVRREALADHTQR